MITYRGNPTGQYERGATMQIHVSGLNETLKRLMKIAEAVNVEKGKLLENLVFDGVVIAKEEVPVDTGELRDSIHGKMYPSKMKGEIIAETDHSIFVEFGTGVHYPNSHPQAGEFGIAHGTYGRGLGNNDYWFYTGQPGNAGGELAYGHTNSTITHGNPANMPMYNTGKDMKNEIMRIVRDVFK